MTAELMFIIAVFLIIAAIVLWPMMKKQSPPKQYPHRQGGMGLMPLPSPGPRFGYRPPTLPTAVADDQIVEASDTEPAVVDVVVLALRAGHELVEGVHPDPEAEPTGCADPDRVDETGEPLPPTTGASVCRVELDEVRAVEPAPVTVTAVEVDQPEV